MTEVSIMMIDRKSSIETEPRTLNFHQIQFARDAALYVINTRTMEEANEIFTEGMTTTATAGSKNTSGFAGDEYYDSAEDEDEDEDEGLGGGGGDGSSVYPSYNYQQFGLRTRNVYTAPF